MRFIVKETVQLYFKLIQCFVETIIIKLVQKLARIYYITFYSNNNNNNSNGIRKLETIHLSDLFTIENKNLTKQKCVEQKQQQN